MKALLTSAALVAILLATTASAVLGGDVSAAVSQSDFQCAANKGWDFVIVRSYLSYGAPDPNVRSTLANAKAGGINYRDIYHFPCVAAGTAKSQIEADINNVGLGNFGTIWLDTEINPSGGCGWDKTDLVSNCQFLSDMISAAQGMGATVGVYSSVYEWGQTVGASCTAGGNLPLWYANYDGQKSFGDFTPFGGWSHASVKQYGDASSIGSQCGIGADADWY